MAIRRMVLQTRNLGARGEGSAPARVAAPPAEPARNRVEPTAFAALDFETADNGRDSACQIALIRVEGGEVVDRYVRYIRPPRSQFLFTHIHGITWERVRGEKTFAQLWPELAPRLAGLRFVAAHNASFDQGVLNACCAAAGLAAPPVEFRCTVRLARQTWDLHPARLPDVCRHLKIPLNHHDAASDAEACARIVLAAGASD